MSGQFVIGQTIEKMIYDLPDTFFTDYGLPKLTQEDKEVIFSGESVPMGEAGSISINEKDSINEMVSISFSENFDEAGYLLWIYQKEIKKKKHLIIILQKGDHCCDWIEQQGGFYLKKGKWWSSPAEQYFPQIDWTTFFPGLQQNSDYGFLEFAPPYTLYPKEGGYEVNLSYDLISMGFDLGEEFLQNVGMDPKKLFLKWDSETGRFSIQTN